MAGLLQKLVGPAGELADKQPILALALGAAFAAVFLSTAVAKRSGDEEDRPDSVGRTVYRQLCRIVWGLLLVALLAGAASVLRSHLHTTREHFRHAHGRVTEVNLQAVRTIWGAEQAQGELIVDLGYVVDEIERLESEDPTRAALVRTKKVWKTVEDNPFVSARHAVSLKQNPRRKGTAVYAGYETDCRFTYKLKNPSDRSVRARLRFPLPSTTSVYNNLAVKLNGESVLDRLRVESGELWLKQDLSGGETFDYEVAFVSRGLSYWYFQIREEREIRDFQLLLRLPDVPQGEINYPEGCMTPTELAATPDGRGSVLAYRLDRAISRKGMGVALPRLSQPGEAASAVLAAAEKGWVLLFAAVLLALTLAGVRFSVLIAVVLCSAPAFGYALVADLHDTFLGFWAAAAVVLVPLFGLAAVVIRRALPGRVGAFVAASTTVYGIAYPFLAGADAGRRTLYLNLCAFVLLFLTAWQLLGKLGRGRSAPSPEPERAA